MNDLLTPTYLTTEDLLTAARAIKDDVKEEILHHTKNLASREELASLRQNSVLDPNSLLEVLVRGVASLESTLARHCSLMEQFLQALPSLVIPPAEVVVNLPPHRPITKNITYDADGRPLSITERELANE